MLSNLTSLKYMLYQCLLINPLKSPAHTYLSFLTKIEVKLVCVGLSVSDMDEGYQSNKRMVSYGADEKFAQPIFNSPSKVASRSHSIHFGTEIYSTC